VVGKRRFSINTKNEASLSFWSRYKVICVSLYVKYSMWDCLLNCDTSVSKICIERFRRKTSGISTRRQKVNINP
jgi:hypothetical protein